MRRALVLIGLCGCDALFGLDSLNYVPDAAAPDAPRVTVMGTATRRWMYQDATNQPIFEPAIFSATSPVMARHRDGSDMAVTWDPSGTFSFEVAEGERYSVIYDTAQVPTEYQLAQPVLAIDDPLGGRPDQVAAPPNTAIEWDNPNTALAAGDMRFATAGVWSYSIPAAIGTSTGKFIVTTPGYQAGQKPALLNAAAHDSLYILHIASNNTVTPNTRVLDAYSPLGNQSQNGGTTTTFSSSLMTLPRPYCLEVHWQHSGDRARFARLYPTFSNPQGDVRLWSVPRMRDVGVRSAFELTLAFVGANDGSYMFQYGDPFNQDVVLLDNTFVVRSIGTGNISCNTQYYAIVSRDTGCPVQDVPELVAPLPYAPTLDGIPVADNVVIGSDGVEPIELKWMVDTPSSSGHTQVSLIQNNVTVRVYMTVDNTVYIHPKDLAANTPYRLFINAFNGGYANAQTGDFFTRSFPAASGIMMTGNFTIAKP